MRRLRGFLLAILLASTGWAAEQPNALPGPDAGRTPSREPVKPAEEYVDFALTQCERVERDLPHVTAVAEVCAKRHLAGGAFQMPWNGQTLQQELCGQAGGFAGMGHPWTKDRTETQKSNDMAIVGWDRAPVPAEVARLESLGKKGVFIIGFGPKDLPELARCAKLCSAFFDTGLPDDRVVTLRSGKKVGRANHLVNQLYGWAFVGELVGALTREGRMPPILKSMTFKDGTQWNERYLWKAQFHDDLTVPPQAAGALARAWIDQMRDHMSRFRATQLDATRKAADLLKAEFDAGRTPAVLTSGHMPWFYVGKYEDALWATNVVDFHSFLSNQVKNVREKVSAGALALRVGYFGEDQAARDLYAEKKLRLIMISSVSIYPEMHFPDNLTARIDTGMAFGDACVRIEGYPIGLFPPSGVMQIVAYEAVNTELLWRLE